MKDIGLDLIDHHVLSVFSLHSIYTAVYGERNPPGGLHTENLRLSTRVSNKLPVDNRFCFFTSPEV